MKEHTSINRNIPITMAENVNISNLMKQNINIDLTYGKRIKIQNDEEELFRIPTIDILKDVKQIVRYEMEPEARKIWERFSSKTYSEVPSAVVGRENFKFVRVIGDGSSCSVFLAQKLGGKDHSKYYAVKVFQKRLYLDSNSARHLIEERLILADIGQTPFLSQLHYAFQTKDQLYLVQDYICGGELHYFLYHHRQMPKSWVQLCVAQLIIALKTLHRKEIMHRDIKPENILIDKEGNLVIIDFGLAKRWNNGKQLTRRDKKNLFTTTYCGTINYMAPEIRQKLPYNESVDIWSLGVLTFELLTGNRFVDVTDEQMTVETLEAHLNQMDQLPYLDKDSKHFIKSLCKWDPLQRMSLDKMQQHPFLRTLDWKKIIEKRIKSKLCVPQRIDNVNETIIPPNITNDITDDQFLELPNTTLYNGYYYVAPQHDQTPSVSCIINETDRQREYCNITSYSKLQPFPNHLKIADEIAHGSYGTCYRIMNGRKIMPTQIVKAIRNSKFRMAELDALHNLCAKFNALLCEFKGAYDAENAIYLMLEYLKGPTLSKFIESGGMSLKPCSIISEQICNALIYIHGKNFIHGDLKPDNIIITDLKIYKIKIIDFGFSSYGGQRRRWCDPPRFTLDYAPPEALQHDQNCTYTLYFDIWCMGATVYHIFMGHPPFRKGRNDVADVSEIKNRIKFQHYYTKDPRFHNAPPALKEFLRVCMHKNILKRPTAKIVKSKAWLSMSYLLY